LALLFVLSAVTFNLTGVAARDKKVPIGSAMEKVAFKDIHYLPRTLDDFGPGKVYVLAFTTTGCPLVQRYLPRLKELASHYRDKNVQFIAVDVGPDDSLKEVAYQAIEHGMNFPFVKTLKGHAPLPWAWTAQRK